MATHDYNLANQSGASFRSDLNDALQAVLTNNSSASAPSSTASYMFWADTNTGILKIRNSANDGWVELLQLDGTLTIEDGSASAVGLGFRDELNTGIFSSGASNFDVSIAGTTRLNISATGLNVTGTVTDDGATHDGDVTFTGASANIVFDKSDNALEFADGALASFGTNTDLTISHVDGTGNVIDSAVGDFFVKHGAETMIKAAADGSVELYEDNQKRIETTASGAAVFRNTADSDVLLLVENEDTGSVSDAIVRIRVAGTSQHSRVEFGDSGDANNGMIDYDHNSVDMTFHVNGSAHYEMDSGAFHPSTDDSDDCGRSTNRWDDIRATNGTIATSDRNEKNTIVTSDLGLDFVNKLTPVSYKFNNKTRTHYGLIAQDIETLLGTLGKSGTDFAGFCKDQITIKTEIDEDGNANEVALDTPFDRYALRYNEFIAPIIKAIQELSAKVTALEGS